MHVCIPYWSLPAEERGTSFDLYDTFLYLEHVRFRYIYDSYTKGTHNAQGTDPRVALGAYGELP